MLDFAGRVSDFSISSNEPKSGRLGINFLESFDSLFLLKAELDLKQKNTKLPNILILKTPWHLLYFE